MLEWANPESEDVEELRKRTAKGYVDCEYFFITYFFGVSNLVGQWVPEVVECQKFKVRFLTWKCNKFLIRGLAIRFPAVTDFQN